MPPLYCKLHTPRVGNCLIISYLPMSRFILKKRLAFQIRAFSSSKSPSSALKSSNQSSFTVDYLINSCGLTPERAASASKHVNFQVADMPDSVLAFLKDQGFTQTQIFKIINSCPALLRCNPEKNFLPKIEFLKSKGISGSQVTAFVSSSPTILAMSLENRLIPSFDFFSNFLQSEEKGNAAFKRFLRFPLSYLENVKPNIEMLKQAGVPTRNIEFFVIYQPNVLLSSCKKYRCVMEEVNKMGFNPLEIRFLKAIQALISMTKLTWDRKIEVYKQWGWSEDDILSAFKKFPYCMTSSGDKINSIMEFLIKEMGLKSSVLAQRPHILSYSLEKRVVPRCVVYQALVSKGLIKSDDTRLLSIMGYSEKYFLERTIGHHQHEAPDLLKLYKQKLDLAK